MVLKIVWEDLGLMLKPLERLGPYDTVPVTMIFGPIFKSRCGLKCAESRPKTLTPLGRPQSVRLNISLLDTLQSFPEFLYP